MTDFKPGELVTVTIENATVATAQPGVLAINYGGTKPGQLDGYITIDTSAKGVTAERVAPAQWPPRHGDVWRDRDGMLWFVSVRDIGGEYAHLEKVFTPADGRRVDRYADYESGRLLRERGPVTLVHREYPDPDDVED